MDGDEALRSASMPPPNGSNSRLPAIARASIEAAAAEASHQAYVELLTRFYDQQSADQETAHAKEMQAIKAAHVDEVRAVNQAKDTVISEKDALICELRQSDEKRRAELLATATAQASGNFAKRLKTYEEQSSQSEEKKRKAEADLEESQRAVKDAMQSTKELEEKHKKELDKFKARHSRRWIQIHFISPRFKDRNVCIRVSAPLKEAVNDCLYGRTIKQDQLAFVFKRKLLTDLSLSLATLGVDDEDDIVFLLKENMNSVLKG